MVRSVKVLYVWHSTSLGLPITNITQLARWQFVEITGILVEVGLFLSLIYLATNVQMEFTAKIKIVLLFGTRLL
jgi:hypothetical protein